MVSGVGDVEPFHRAGPPAWDGGERFGSYIEAMREVQDLVTGTSPPDDVLEQATGQLEAVAELLRGYRRPEGELIAGRRHDLPGRGNPFFPPFEIDAQDGWSVRGRVTFSDFHLGGGDAAHGGSLSLMFDEVMGWLANSGGRPIARTAYLHIDYRNVTPLRTELRFEAEVVREEGRKVVTHGRLLDGDTVLVEVECLFVVLQPAAPPASGS